ncbi:hypothetical protein [Flavobacterium psychrotolerans]|uniref:hypothetical protein n=1 Tax=Flavobacterium psychrotolerans TaxID=2169410 RepID=UPI00140DA486|nr:hypothetical protein [Flavobacterium psychrotolerans]
MKNKNLENGKNRNLFKQKKSFLLLIASLIFVIGGIYMFMNAENSTGYRVINTLFTKEMC